MKTIWSKIEALLLCFCIMLYGVMSDAGTKTGIGTFEMVICSGDGAVTVVTDANGNPVTPPHPCCDCLTCDAPATALAADAFRLSAAPARFSNLVISVAGQIPAPPYTARSQARAPPPATRKNGVSALPGCGLVSKDTAA